MTQPIEVGKVEWYEALKIRPPEYASVLLCRKLSDPNIVCIGLLASGLWKAPDGGCDKIRDGDYWAYFPEVPECAKKPEPIREQVLKWYRCGVNKGRPENERKVIIKDEKSSFTGTVNNRSPFGEIVRNDDRIWNIRYDNEWAYLDEDE